MTSISVESSSYLKDQGFAVYCLRITADGSTAAHVAKRYSVLRAHHSEVVGNAHPNLAVPFPAASTYSYLVRSSTELLETRKRELDAYFSALPDTLARAMAKSLIAGDPGAGAALPAGGLAPDGSLDSLYAPIIVPSVSLTEYVLSNVHKAKSGTAAIIDGPSDRAILYCDLGAQINACAAGLAARGFGKGHVLAILSPNVPEYAIAFHAVASLGGVVTTLNPLYTAAEVCHQLKDANATFLLTVGAFGDKAKEAVAGTSVSRLILFDAAADDDAAKPVPLTAFRSLLLSKGQPEEGQGGSAPQQPAAAIHPEDVVAIPYSSGTSGLPKGVELTHRNIVANLVQITDSHLQLTAADTLIGVLPFFHIYGMVVILNAALARLAKVVSMPKFDPGEFLGHLKKHNVTIAHVAPPIVGFLAKHPAVDSVLPLPHLRELFSGAAPLGGELAAAAKERLGLEHVRQGYGSTLSPAEPKT